MLAAITMTACGQGTPGKRAKNEALELLVATEPVTLDPRFATRALDVRLTRLVHSGLVSLHPDTLIAELNLAKSISIENDRTVVVELKPNQFFHSGQALRAEDVCATLTALSDSRLLSPHRTIVDSFVNCRLRGPLTISFDMRTPRASYLTDLEVPILRADEAHAPQRANGNLDGLGPYFVSRRDSNCVVLSPAQKRNSKTAKYSIAVRTVSDENVRAMRVLSGRAELAPNAFSPTLISGFNNTGVLVRSRPGANVSYLLANGDRAPFSEPSVRRALSLAIDRKLLTKELFSSLAQPANWLLPKGHWAAPKTLGELPFNPNGARQTLSQLPSATLLTSTDRSRVLQARAVAQMLTDAGLQTTVVPLELGLLISRLDAGQYTLAILQIPELTEPNVLRWFFHSSGIDSPTEGRNRARYRSAVASQLLDDASRELNFARRQQLYFELANVMLEDMPVIPLWHEDQIAVVRDRARAFVPSAEGRWNSLAAL